MSGPLNPQKHYDKLLKKYTFLLNLKMILAGGKKNLRKKLLNKIKSFTHSHILELCCGPGNLTKQIAGTCPDCSIIGVDINENFIRLTQKDIRYPCVSFSVGDAARLSFKENSFDTIVLCFALHEMAPITIENILREMRRVLKNGGNAVLIEHALPHNPIVRWWYHWFIVGHEERETCYAFHKYGFKRYIDEVGLRIMDDILMSAGIIEIIVAAK